MGFTYNNKIIEKITYNNKQVNVAKFKGNIILEDNYINNSSFQGNETITSLNGELTEKLSFKSNNIEFTGIKITSDYVYYINNNEETPVYSYSNNSWAELYRTIDRSTFEKEFVSTRFYNWFNINYILVL